jgi:hypothetical protein
MPILLKHTPNEEKELVLSGMLQLVIFPFATWTAMANKSHLMMKLPELSSSP